MQVLTVQSNAASCERILVSCSGSSLSPKVTSSFETALLVINVGVLFRSIQHLQQVSVHLMRHDAIDIGIDKGDRESLIFEFEEIVSQLQKVTVT